MSATTKGSRVSSRYAKSLLDLAIEQGSLESAYADMLLISKTCLNSRDLVVMLKSPIIKTDQKINILDAIFKNKVSELTIKFVNIITSKKREYLLDEIAHSFVHQYKVLKHTSVAVVTTAMPLTAEQSKAIEAIVAEHFGGNIEIESHVDPEIIGGIILRVDDKQVDASVISKLRELKKVFSHNPHIKAF